MLLARRNNNRNWMTNFFDDFFPAEILSHTSAMSTPAINVKEDAKAYTMEVATPGLKKEYCRVNIDQEGNLHIQLEAKMEHKGEDKHEHYIRREFAYTNFEQRYALPDNVNRKEIEARVEDGVLHITLPKHAPEAEQQMQQCIEVK